MKTGHVRLWPKYYLNSIGINHVNHYIGRALIFFEAKIHQSHSSAKKSLVTLRFDCDWLTDHFDGYIQVYGLGFRYEVLVVRDSWKWERLRFEFLNRYYGPRSVTQNPLVQGRQSKGLNYNLTAHASLTRIQFWKDAKKKTSKNDLLLRLYWEEHSFFYRHAVELSNFKNK